MKNVTSIPPTPSPASPPAPIGRRAVRNARNRLALLHAAADVVGEVGYQDASVARIVEKAGLSNGTFYIHFHSRQDILDQLLPVVGEEIFDFMHRRIEGAQDFLQVEERGVRAYFTYIEAHPSYFRVFNEAQLFAPQAYKTHVEAAIGHFVTSLTRSQSRGELPGYVKSDLPLLARIMLAARAQIYEAHLHALGDRKRRKEAAVRAYLRFIANGLRAKAR